MTHKRILWIVMVFLLAACGSKTPGMSKEDAAKALNEQVAQQAAAEEPVGVAVTEFPEDYTPRAGIKYQSKIVKGGAVMLNVEAALKNIRPMKVSELGKMEVHRVGVESFVSMSRTGIVMPLENGYLLSAVQGLYLLNNDFQLERQLFQNAVDVSYGDFPFISPKQMINDTYHDLSCRQLRCTFLQNNKIQKRWEDYMITLPLDALLASAKPMLPEAVTSKLPIKLSGKSFAGIKGGFATSAHGLNSIYTFGAKGDTLCHFKLGNPSDYESGDIPRSGEGGNRYIYQNKTYFRVAYDNTLYQLEDASTLKAVYQLNFGTLPRATRKVVSNNKDIDDLYFVEHWLESDRYLFIRLARGYDCPSSRDAGIVSLYTLLYDKQRKAFFSLPPSKSKKIEFPVPEADGAEGLAFFPNFVVDGMPVMILNGKSLKEACSKGMEALGFTDVSDNELFIISIK